MVMNQIPDWAQGALEEIFNSMLIESVEWFIDHVLAFNNNTDADTWKYQLKLIYKVLHNLETHVSTLNTQKCFWWVQDTPWLGHWMITTGINPPKNKLDVIIIIAPPNNLLQLRWFFGIVNYYTVFWSWSADIMASLMVSKNVMTKYFHKHCKHEHLECFK